MEDGGVWGLRLHAVHQIRLRVSVISPSHLADFPLVFYSFANLLILCSSCETIVCIPCRNPDFFLKGKSRILGYNCSGPFWRCDVITVIIAALCELCVVRCHYAK